MKSVLPILILLAMFSCKKPDDQPATLPPYTCSDAADDGRFEIWNDAERGLFSPADPAPAITFTNAESSGDITSVSLTKASIVVGQSIDIKCESKNAFILYAVRSYKTDEGVANKRTLVLSGSKGNSLATVAGPSTADTVSLPGCNRVYYIFTDITGKELTKGHFDIQVTQ